MKLQPSLSIELDFFAREEILVIFGDPQFSFLSMLTRAGPSASLSIWTSCRLAACVRGQSLPFSTHLSFIDNQKPVSFRVRFASSSSSSTRWKSRQTQDSYTREARVAGLKSRAAFKLLEIDAKHRLFAQGDTVVDLGFAPGSWSQVAVHRVKPGGRVVGIDVIPAQPPKGVNALQGNFLSPEVREQMRRFVSESGRGRVRDANQASLAAASATEEEKRESEGVTAEELEERNRGIVEIERLASEQEHDNGSRETGRDEKEEDEKRDRDQAQGRVVNVVLSDMSAPWPLITSSWVRSVSNPYLRMMNTSGMPFRDHAGSMVSLSLFFLPSSSVFGFIHFYCLFIRSFTSGSLHGRFGFLLRNPGPGRTLPLQVLCRSRRSTA